MQYQRDSAHSRSLVCRTLRITVLQEVNGSNYSLFLRYSTRSLRLVKRDLSASRKNKISRCNLMEAPEAYPNIETRLLALARLRTTVLILTSATVTEDPSPLGPPD
jgi:hypothetical protein